MGKDMLERLGYRATVRSNSIKALNTFKSQPDKFDLAIPAPDAALLFLGIIALFADKSIDFRPVHFHTFLHLVNGGAVNLDLPVVVDLLRTEKFQVNPITVQQSTQGILKGGYPMSDAEIVSAGAIQDLEQFEDNMRVVPSLFANFDKTLVGL
jgi:hypothetical protein